MNDYYVYVYLNPLVKGKFVYDNYEFEFEPFYVGKGKSNRYKSHLYNRSLKRINEKNKIIKEILSNNIKPIIKKIHTELIEKKSFDIEMDVINKIGVIYGNGPLTNLTKGGEGAYSTKISKLTRKKLSECGKRNGRKGKTLEEYFGEEKGKELREINRLKFKNKTYEEIYGIEKSMKIKQKQSNSQRGKKKITEEGKNILREYHLNKKVSDETKKRISISLIGHKRNLGKVHTEETKNKISESKKGSIPWNKTKILQFDKDMSLIREWDSSTDAAKKLNVRQGNISSAVNGKRKTAYGFIWIKK